ncbi:nucleoside phosphorylase domain-containing protein [Sporodiniella umbellata]|nr:nucleoside phosphorylase domain-containing protein [Sporodiniella umbellata]
MKEVIEGANFPRDAEGKVYHMSVKTGEVANRILTVGDHVRARRIAKFLDSEEASGHPVFEKSSQRGFLTITGRYKGVPVSIIAIGMGTSMMDFFVRETRASTEGTIAIIRFGSCGSLSASAPTGAVIIPKAGFCIRRNMDYFAEAPIYPELKDKPYLFSGTFAADKDMTDLLATHIEKALDPIQKDGLLVGPVLTGGLNADGCSFYSAQGRTDANFWDDNEGVLQETIQTYPETHSIEMETSVLFHLAKCARNPVRAAGCMQVFADRLGNKFIRPEVVAALEPAVGQACLDALIQVKLDDEIDVAGTVWEPRQL